MAPDIALGAIPEDDLKTLTVLDPMCGSGTVLAAAMARGHDAIGVDIDPLSVMMSELAITPIDSAKMVDWAESTLSVARVEDSSPPWGDDPETGDFVDYWFARRQKMQLIRIVGAIAKVDEPEMRLALQLALSRIIVTKSPQASLAADTAHSRPHRVRRDSDYDVFDGFLRSTVQLSRILGQRRIRGVGTVSIGDARDLVGVADGSVDLVVTSPPYLNALDYLRGHRLALVWFGHRIADLRTRRSESIGSERALGYAPPPVAASIVQELERASAAGAVPRRAMLERFAEDCVRFSEQLGAKTKPGGAAVLVVGNSTIRGSYIPNDLVVTLAMESAGFNLVAREARPIPTSSRYMAINTKEVGSSMGRRMRDEVVLTMVR